LIVAERIRHHVAKHRTGDHAAPAGGGVRRDRDHVPGRVGRRHPDERGHLPRGVLAVDHQLAVPALPATRYWGTAAVWPVPPGAVTTASSSSRRYAALALLSTRRLVGSAVGEIGRASCRERV